MRSSAWYAPTTPIRRTKEEEMASGEESSNSTKAFKIYKENLISELTDYPDEPIGNGGGKGLFNAKRNKSTTPFPPSDAGYPRSPHRRILRDRNEAMADYSPIEEPWPSTEMYLSTDADVKADSVADLHRRIRKFLTEELALGWASAPPLRLVDDARELSDLSEDSADEGESMPPYHPVHAPFSPRPRFLRFRRSPRMAADVRASGCEHCQHCKQCGDRTKKERKSEEGAQELVARRRKTEKEGRITKVKEEGRAKGELERISMSRTDVRACDAVEGDVNEKQEGANRRKLDAGIPFPPGLRSLRRRGCLLIVFFLGMALCIAGASPTFLPSLYENPLSMFYLEANLSEPAMDILNGLLKFPEGDSERINEKSIRLAKHHLHTSYANLLQFARAVKKRLSLGTLQHRITSRFIRVRRVLRKLRDATARRFMCWIQSRYPQWFTEITDRKAEEIASSEGNWAGHCVNEFDMGSANRIYFDPLPHKERKSTWNNVTELLDSREVKLALSDTAIYSIQRNGARHSGKQAPTASLNMPSQSRCPEVHGNEALDPTLPSLQQSRDDEEAREVGIHEGVEVQRELCNALSRENSGKKCGELEDLEEEMGTGQIFHEIYMNSDETRDPNTPVSSNEAEVESLGTKLADQSFFCLVPAPILAILPSDENINVPMENLFQSEDSLVGNPTLPKEEMFSLSQGKEQEQPLAEMLLSANNENSQADLNEEDRRMEEEDSVYPERQGMANDSKIVQRGFSLRVLISIVVAAIIGVPTYWICSHPLPLSYVACASRWVLALRKKDSKIVKGQHDDELPHQLVAETSFRNSTPPEAQTEPGSFRYSTPPEAQTEPGSFRYSSPPEAQRESNLNSKTFASFGSYTDYVESSGSKGEKVVTPVRRSNRIRNHVLSPSVDKQKNLWPS